MSSPQMLEQTFSNSAQEGVQVGMGGQSEKGGNKKKTQPLAKECMVVCV